MRRTIAVSLGLACACVAGAAEFRPVAVRTAPGTEAFSPAYAAEKMLDGDLGTYACLLDDSRDGTNPKAIPPLGHAPVTASFTLDLGRERSVCGLRFVARDAWVQTMATRVSVLAAEDPDGMTGARMLAANVTLPDVINSYSAFVTWPKTAARYLKVVVHDANQQPRGFPWKGPFYEWAGQNGDPLSSAGDIFNVQIAEVRAFDAEPADVPRPNRPDEAYPEERLRRDWIYQDYGLKGMGVVEKWSDAEKAAYFEKCAKRRVERLAWLRAKTDRFVYAKHHVFGSDQGVVGCYDIPDDQVRKEGWGWHSKTRLRDGIPATEHGGQLCLATIRPDGTVANEVLIDRPFGMVCYPNVSWDGKTLVFAMRDNYEADSLYLYTMDLATRKVTRITFPELVDGRPAHVADSEPMWLPNGDIVFASTRSVHCCDCWPRAGGDIYTCRADGSRIRRLTSDQLQTNLPGVSDDGRIVFTRWEYADRTALYLHPLFTMNPDGTGQTEFYGNNSMFPSSLLWAHGIPGSTKMLAVAGGHHVPYKGKLVLVDNHVGRQAGEGLEWVAGAAPDRAKGRKSMVVKPRGINDFKIDIFGQDGPQWAYPFALDEDHYLTAYHPEGLIRLYGPYRPPFGAYFMDADGNRELLAFDWAQQAGAVVPVMARAKPPVRVDTVDPKQNDGTFYVQDVYYGPAMKGVARGTVKKLRVVGLEYRPARMGFGQNGGECESGLNQTPISLNSGSWDVKHVLGEVDVEADGSCSFKVPARMPVYFQLLDAKGYTVQWMRSWSTLQPGERFGCVGCHEDKNDVTPSASRAPLALTKPPQTLKPACGGTTPHPLLARLEKEAWYANVTNYLGVNMVRSLDPDAPTEGFSYRRRIQPILDRNCVKCHDGRNPKTKLCLTGEVADPAKIELIHNYGDKPEPKRAYTRSYVELTTSGRPDGNKWMTWLKPRSRTELLPPYHTGSSQSPVIMSKFEPTHHGVQATEEEKRTFACWLDLLIPFCGSYCEANTWTPAEKREFDAFQKKRLVYALREVKDLQP